jgi:hypothetical protein
MPTPPATDKAPVAVLLAKVVFVMVNMSGDVTSVVVIVVYCMSNSWATILPPTYKLPPIPTPPATVNAPVVVLVAGVVLTLVSPFTYKLPPIPTPPVTVRAP